MLSSKFNLIFLINVLPCFIKAHKDDSYYHDTGDLSPKKDWMKSIKDDVRIRFLSIPGTHDSASLHGGDSVQTQSLRLDQQLSAGIRYFDIRCRHVKNSFSIHHGLVYQKLNFDDVMTTMKNFLEENPSETVLMVIKEEYEPSDNSRSFRDTFNTYFEKYKSVIWTGYDSEQNPKLGDIRGKIVFVQIFDTKGSRFGIEQTFDEQNFYQMGTNSDLYKKWTKVKDQLEKANQAPKNDHQGFLNFLTGSGGSFPYFVSSGHSNPATDAPRLSTGKVTTDKKEWPDFPRLDCLGKLCSIFFEGINILTKNYILDKKPNFVGIIMSDFPGQGLIKAIIEVNKETKNTEAQKLAKKERKAKTKQTKHKTTVRAKTIKTTFKQVIKETDYPVQYATVYPYQYYPETQQTPLIIYLVG